MALGLAYAGFSTYNEKLFITGYIGYLIPLLRVLFYDLWWLQNSFERWLAVGAGVLGVYAGDPAPCLLDAEGVPAEEELDVGLGANDLFAVAPLSSLTTERFWPRGVIPISALALPPMGQKPPVQYRFFTGVR